MLKQIHGHLSPTEANALTWDKMYLYLSKSEMTCELFYVTWHQTGLLSSLWCITVAWYHRTTIVHQKIPGLLKSHLTMVKEFKWTKASSTISAWLKAPKGQLKSHVRITHKHKLLVSKSQLMTKMYMRKVLWHVIRLWSKVMLNQSSKPKD